MDYEFIIFELLPITFIVIFYIFCIVLMLYVIYRIVRSLFK